LGAEVHTREPVLEWDIDDGRGEGSVWVRTDRETYRARRLVVTAGSWARSLVPALGELAVPERQVLLWTQPLRPELFLPDSFPIFNMEANMEGAKGHYYGFPAYGVPGFKIGKYHHRHERVDPDDMDRDCHPQDEAVLREAIRNYFPDADGPTLAMKTCLFTNSPDEHFILDHHADHREVA